VNTALSYDQQQAILRSFMKAADDGDIAALSKHLENGVNVNTRDWEGETAAINAAFNNHAAALKLLIRGGADLSLRHDQGGTALICAIEKGHADCVRALIDGFAPLDQPNYAGVTPVHLAHAAKRPDIAQMLGDAIATEAARRDAASIFLQESLSVRKPLILKGGIP
jgi:ankyrin repeat protein